MPTIDAVEILTPTHLHYAHVNAALAAGKHVSVQKPITNTVDEALELGKMAEARRAHPAGERVLRALPPARAGQEADRRGSYRHGPSDVRIRTVVGQTDSAFQADLRPEGYGWRLDKRSPGGHLFDDNVHKYAMALWLVDQDIISVQAVVRRRDIFFEPCAIIFEYEDPDLLGTMEVQYAREHVDAVGILRRRRVLRDPRRRRVRVGDAGHGRDARPGPCHALPGRRASPDLHRVRPRSTPTGAPGFVGPRRTSSTPCSAGTPAAMSAAEAGQGPSALLRRLPGLRHTPAGGPPHHFRVGHAVGLGRMVSGGHLPRF